eukprot:GILK01011158.1.p1 GENE.GILK01011158.1~~GILK01011158.1.p1  ORF type:complete len:503 (+),score=79.27 GILK01011158.1:67-1509(+)
MEDDACLICANGIRFFAIGVCDHKLACSMCALRLRLVMKDTACCFCKAEQERIVITKDSSRPFESYPIYGDMCGPNMIFDEESGAFFDDKEYYAEIKRLRGFHCTFRGCKVEEKQGAFASIEELKKHLQAAHNHFFCDLCLASRKVFLGEQQLFSAKQLAVHSQRGDIGTPFKGHPLCEFCSTRFYGELELYQHLNSQHESCHICQRTDPNTHIYYGSYADMEDHFRKDHHLCEEPQCLETRFIVFDNPIDLQAHMAETHNKVNQKIAINFRVRRAGWTGEGLRDEQDGVNNSQRVQVFAFSSPVVDSNLPIPLERNARSMAQDVNLHMRLDSAAAYPPLSSARAVSRQTALNPSNFPALQTSSRPAATVPTGRGGPFYTSVPVNHRWNGVNNNRIKTDSADNARRTAPPVSASLYQPPARARPVSASAWSAPGSSQTSADKLFPAQWMGLDTSVTKAPKPKKKKVAPRNELANLAIKRG